MNKLELARIVLDFPELEESALILYWSPKCYAHQWQALIEFIAERIREPQCGRFIILIRSKNIEGLEMLAMELI